jgi:hypothetical protein
MIAAPLLALLCGPPADPPGAREIPALIRDLGAPAYSRREASTTALQAMGKAALPALADALGSRDPEVRDRASALIAQIRRADLIGPTLLALDFRDRPAGEVAKALAERSGFAIILHPAADADRKVTLAADARVPFWEALEQFSEIAAIREDRRARNLLGPNEDPEAPALALYPLGLVGPPPPTWVDGKFRIRQVHALEALADPGMFGRRGRRRADIDPATPIAEIFLEIAVEPQATVQQSGPIEFTESVDAKGEPIPATDERFGDEQFNLMMARGGLGRMGRGPLIESDRTTALIRLIADPSRGPARIKGKIPVTVSQFRDPATAIDLATAVGKTFELDGAVLQITDFAVERTNRTARLEVALRVTPGGPAEADAASRMGDAWPDLKVVDDGGKPLVSAGFPPGQVAQGNEVRRAWNYRIGSNGKPPAKLLVRSAERATTSVAFEFREVKLTGGGR